MFALKSRKLQELHLALDAIFLKISLNLNQISSVRSFFLKEELKHGGRKSPGFVWGSVLLLDGGGGGGASQHRRLLIESGAGEVH